MKVADVWNEAADLAEMWASITRARARRLTDGKKTALHLATADQVDALARAYRHKAKTDEREIDFDDRITPVRSVAAGLLCPDDDPTDPG